MTTAGARSCWQRARASRGWRQRWRGGGPSFHLCMTGRVGNQTLEVATHGDEYMAMEEPGCFHASVMHMDASSPLVAVEAAATERSTSNPLSKQWRWQHLKPRLNYGASLGHFLCQYRVNHKRRCSRKKKKTRAIQCIYHSLPFTYARNADS